MGKKKKKEKREVKRGLKKLNKALYNLDLRGYDDFDDDELDQYIFEEYGGFLSLITRPSITAPYNIPSEMILSAKAHSGFYMGGCFEPGFYVGKPSTKDGNILVVGKNGCGKSHCIAKSVVLTWLDSFVVLDIKGELSEQYLRFHSPDSCIIFDPLNGGMHYDRATCSPQ